MQSAIIFLSLVLFAEGFLVKRQNYYPQPQQQQQGYYQNRQYNANSNYNPNYNNQYRNQGAQQYQQNSQYAQQTTTTTTLSPEAADALAAQYMDPFVLLGHLQELIPYFQNGSSIINDIQTNTSLTEADKVEKIAQWYNELPDVNTDDQNVDQFRTRFLNLSSTAATEAGNLMNNQSESVLNAWKQMTSITASLMSEKMTIDMYKQEINKIYNAMPLDDQTAFKADFRKLYGYDFTPSTE